MFSEKVHIVMEEARPTSTECSSCINAAGSLVVGVTLGIINRKGT